MDRYWNAYTTDLKGWKVKHGECRELTTAIGDIIEKTLTAEDGATWNEVTRPVKRVCPVTVTEGITVELPVSFMETEYWYSDGYDSHFVYDAI